jgi:hypothetical protein
MSFVDSIDAVFVKIARYLNFAILENKSEIESKRIKRKEELLVLLVIKVQGLIFLWCPERDLNPQAVKQRILRPPCIPFHHLGKFIWIY